MSIDRVAMKQATDEGDLRRKQMQTRRDSLGVFAENTRAFFDDLHHTRISSSCSFKNYGRQRCDLHFVGRLHPANQFIKIVQ